MLDDLKKYWEEQFIKILILLSSNSEKQIEYGEEFIDTADEIVLDLYDAHQAVRAYNFFNNPKYLSAKEDLEILDKFLDEKSGENNAKFWTNESLRTDPLWQKIREMAFEILKKINKDNYDVKIIASGNTGKRINTKTDLILKS